jgi:hypothetical protein
MPAKMSSDEKKWRTEDDLRTLANAEEIKADKTRMAACRAMAKEKMAQMQAATGTVTK